MQVVMNQKLTTYIRNKKSGWFYKKISAKAEIFVSITDEKVRKCSK